MTQLDPELEATVRRWIEDDPDGATRAELEELLAAAASEASAGSAASAAELADRFADRLHFGTAGLRGAVAAGPNRMNRAVVRMATAALARWLDANRPGARAKGVVLGCDARHGSSEFTEEAALVLTGAGYRVLLLPEQRPTPLLAFAVPHLDAAAGVMITASHNPPGDNGYKLYLGDGAQIVPPVDAEIEEIMADLGSLPSVPLGDLEGPLTEHVDGAIEDDFVAALAQVSPAPAGASDLRVVYTAMHGVARHTFEAALAAAGYGPAILVASQADPDPDFPTVAFPNPEEPGALDLALEAARRHGADTVIANDPDGDRLAVAVPDPAAEGGWRPLSGDQLGSLLAASLLLPPAEAPAPDAVVATTIVSSSLLSKIAGVAGCTYRETLTGFKWIARAPTGGGSLLFGYEEALGYSVGGVVRDKDGIGAALAWLALLTRARAKGRTAWAMWDELERRFGVHLTRQISVRSDDPGSTLGRFRAKPPEALGGSTVVARYDLADPGSDAADSPYAGLPASEVLVYRTEMARVILRPSGTEPKLKVYLEVVRPVDDGDLAAGRAAALDELEAVRSDVEGMISE